jgi:beta-glucanase (GH16 family)
MYIQQNSYFKIKMPSLAIITALLLYSTSALAQQCQPLVWEDDFNQTSIDTSVWDVQTGDGCDQGAGMCGWGNSELQSYQADNITLANGIMTIQAKKERIKSTQYTSGRIRTANMAGSGEWTYGRFEARMKIPEGQGMWPAFWMLPTDPVEGWPMSGEIDIFESVGQSANMSYGTLHYGQPWPDNSHTGGSMLMQPGKWSDDFHTYTVEWESDEIRWYVDNMLYSVKTVADLAPEDWPFDGRNNFHLILNLAVGGTWGGTVDDAALPQTLAVDYVRVYGGVQPNLTGNHLPTPSSTETYTVDNAGGTTTWAVTGGTVSGSGASVDITWDAASASTTQTLTATSGGCDVTTQIYVGKNLTSETVLNDYDGTSNMSVTSTNGTYTEGNGVLTYTRDSASQWDVISATTSAIPDANSYIIGDKAFQLDINNTNQVLVGKEIIIQLEDSSVATPSNFPGGRHSKYNAYIENANGWQTLRFSLIERLDGSTADNAVDSILFLIDPNNFTSDTYVLDNIEILGEGGSTPTNNAPTASINSSCSDLSCDFDGSASSDSDGSVVSYAWDFGDGNTANSSTASHNYAQAGTYTVSLTVTDNEGAVDMTNTEVTVSTSTGGTATSTIVNSVVTGTESAGKGKKYGTATVTILDDLGNPVEGVTVQGDFSGTWNETATATTDANGIANLITTTSLGGAVTVNFCVRDISGGLPFDSSASNNVCQ